DRKEKINNPVHRYENVFTMEESLTLSLDTANKDEPLYTPSVVEGEETKTIPVFNGEDLPQSEEETFVHNEDKDTKKFSAAASDASSNKGDQKKKPFFKRKGFYFFLLLFVIIIGLAVY